MGIYPHILKDEPLPVPAPAGLFFPRGAHSRNITLCLPKLIFFNNPRGKQRGRLKVTLKIDVLGLPKREGGGLTAHVRLKGIKVAASGIDKVKTIEEITGKKEVMGLMIVPVLLW